MLKVYLNIEKSNCSNLLDVRNLQEQVKKAFCYQKLFWPFTVWINCCSDLNSQQASNFKKFSRSLEQFFLTVGQNNFVNKIPYFHFFSNQNAQVLMHQPSLTWQPQKQISSRGQFTICVKKCRTGNILTFSCSNQFWVCVSWAWT